MVLYMYPMCQCGLHAVLWSRYDILMRLFAAEPRSTARLLFHSQCLYETIVLTTYSIVWYWLVSRAVPMFFNGPMLVAPFLSSTVVPFSSFFL